jgi:hypothetical protein
LDTEVVLLIIEQVQIQELFRHTLPPNLEWQK